MICTSLTMPTAVMTESSEKTMSMTMICDHHGHERRRGLLPLGLLVGPFELAVDLERGLGDQEQAADQQDQAAAREIDAEESEQRRRQAHDPRDREQEQDARDERAAKAELSRPRLFRLGQLARTGSR